MVRSGGNSVRALGYHTGPGYFFVYLHTREVSADTRLSALTHLYLDSGAGVEVLLEHAETSGSYLAYRIGAVLVEILVQTALAGVVVGSQLLSRSRKGLMRVLRNGAEGHRGEHHRNVQLEVRIVLEFSPAVLVVVDLLLLLAKEGLGLHRLAQRVDRRVCYLGSVQQYLVPVNRVLAWVAHRREEHSAGACLLVDLVHYLLAPVAVLAELVLVLSYLERSCRAERHTALAVNAVRFIGYHSVEVGVVMVHLVGTLALTDAALYAAVRVADHLKQRIHIVNSHL